MQIYLKGSISKSLRKYVIIVKHTEDDHIPVEDAMESMLPNYIVLY